MPKISVIMGAYNCENTLQASIESILGQTYTDWECIICDDGSTDTTHYLISEYIKKDARIKLLTNTKNTGLAYSLNRGLKVARGEYIARMDSDDISLPTRFEKQIAYLEQHEDIAVLGTTAQYFDNQGVWGVSKAKKCLTKTDIMCGNAFIHPTVMIRRKALQQVGGYTVSKYTYRMEDYDLWCKLYAHYYRGDVLNEPLLQYRLDKSAYKKRRYCYRIDEFLIKKYWHKKLEIPKRYYIYVIKPLIIGMIPGSLMRVYHMKIYKKMRI